MTQEKPALPDVIVLTGSMGSGKSTVSKMLRDLGAAVVDADELAREVVSPGAPALDEIKHVFGPEFITAAGELDRKKLGETVFADGKKLVLLESITHPRIRDLAVIRFAAERARKPPLLVYDCPLFFEAKLDKKSFRGVIVVNAPENECIARVMKRDKLTEEQARLRLSHQIALAEKVSKADFVIENGGSVDELRAKVAGLFRRLTA